MRSDTNYSSSAPNGAGKIAMSLRPFYVAIGTLCLLSSKYLLAPLDAKVLAVGKWAAIKADPIASTTSNGGRQ